jgi:alpha-L-rhamnosidase
VTDTKAWEYFGEGPYLYSGFFQGERQDGRKLSLYDEFSGEDYKIENPKYPVEVVPDVIEEYSTMPAGFGRPWPKIDHGKTKIVGGVQAPVVEVCRRRAVSMTEPRTGLYIYDLGQEMAGVPYIRLKGEAGTLVTIRYGEMLYPELPEYGNLHGLMLTENYRDAESIDKYILNGNPEGEIFTPKFSFHGYRYIEISGVSTPPSLDDVESIQLSSIPKLTGKLETSEPLLNRLIENVGWSQLCNFISIPTDCPQRNERMGWAGDAHVFCKTASYQSDARLFYYRYLEAFADLQEESGQLPNIAPIGGGFGGITYESAMIIMVWELYQQYGDLEVIRRYYEPMGNWCEYIKGQGMPGMANVGPLGDWLASDETDNSLIWNTFYGYDMELMAKMAKAIGKDKDALMYEEWRKEAKDFWNNTFVDAESGMTKGADGKINDTQCAYALPLAYHMFADEYRDKAYDHLARKTREKGEVIGTGFFGTGVINPMLTEGGHTELAYKLLLQIKYPSWLYPVTQGATTVWERWNSYTVENGFGGNNSMNSFNHYSLGSVLSWIYETVLGIQRDEARPGFHHFSLKPAMMVLEKAEGGFETNYGRIESSWERQAEGGYLYKCDIPCNTSATVCLGLDENKHEMELGSGHYEFICKVDGGVYKNL